MPCTHWGWMNCWIIPWSGVKQCKAPGISDWGLPKSIPFPAIKDRNSSEYKTVPCIKPARFKPDSHSQLTPASLDKDCYEHPGFLGSQGLHLHPFPSDGGGEDEEENSSTQSSGGQEGTQCHEGTETAGNTRISPFLFTGDEADLGGDFVCFTLDYVPRIKIPAHQPRCLCNKGGSVRSALIHSCGGSIPATFSLALGEPGEGSGAWISFLQCHQGARTSLTGMQWPLSGSVFDFPPGKQQQQQQQQQQRAGDVPTSIHPWGLFLLLKNQ